MSISYMYVYDRKGLVDFVQYKTFCVCNIADFLKQGQSLAQPAPLNLCQCFTSSSSTDLQRTSHEIPWPKPLL